MSRHRRETSGICLPERSAVCKIPVSRFNVVSDGGVSSTVASVPLEAEVANTHTRLRFYGTPLTLAVPIPLRDALTASRRFSGLELASSKIWSKDHLLERIAAKG